LQTLIGGGKVFKKKFGLLSAINLSGKECDEIIEQIFDFDSTKVSFVLLWLILHPFFREH